MTLRRSAPLAALALLLAAGCSGVTARPGAPAPPTPAGTAPGGSTIATPPRDPAPPLPEEVARQGRPPEPVPGVRGVYRLVEVGDTALPAVVDRRGACELRAVQGTLSLDVGGFTFSGVTQEVCGGTARPGVTHRAEGRYDREGTALTFTAGAGTTFGSARGQLLGDDVIQVTEVSAGGRTRAVNLEFRREEPPRPQP